MKDLVEVIAKALVEHPEDVIVKEEQNGRVVRIDLLVNPSDMGKVIGRQGRIAKAIRSVVKAAATMDDLVADVNIDASTPEEGITETAEDGNHTTNPVSSLYGEDAAVLSEEDVNTDSMNASSVL